MFNQILCNQTIFGFWWSEVSCRRFQVVVEIVEWVVKHKTVSGWDDWCQCCLRCWYLSSQLVVSVNKCVRPMISWFYRRDVFEKSRIVQRDPCHDSCEAFECHSARFHEPPFLYQNGTNSSNEYLLYLHSPHCLSRLLFFQEFPLHDNPCI